MSRNAEAKRIRHGTTILLADDDEALRTSTGRALLRNGYQVIEAADGAEALRLSRDHEGPIDLLITDVIMPNVDGVKLADQLRLDRPDTKVLYISGYLESLLISGRSHHEVILQKPFAPEVLIAKIHELLETRVRGSDMDG